MAHVQPQTKTPIAIAYTTPATPIESRTSIHSQPNTGSATQQVTGSAAQQVTGSAAQQVIVISGCSAYTYTFFAHTQLSENLSHFLTKLIRENHQGAEGKQKTDLGLESILASYETKLTESTRRVSELQTQVAELKTQLAQQFGQSSATRSSSVGGLPQPTPSAPVQSESAGHFMAVFKENGSKKLMKQPTNVELTRYEFKQSDGTQVVVKLSKVLAPQWQTLAGLFDVPEREIINIKIGLDYDKPVAQLMRIIGYIRGRDSCKTGEPQHKMDFTWKKLFEKIAFIDSVREDIKVQALANKMGVSFVRIS